MLNNLVAKIVFAQFNLECGLTPLTPTPSNPLHHKSRSSQHFTMIFTSWRCGEYLIMDTAHQSSFLHESLACLSSRAHQNIPTRMIKIWTKNREFVFCFVCLNYLNVCTVGARTRFTKTMSRYRDMVIFILLAHTATSLYLTSKIRHQLSQQLLQYSIVGRLEQEAAIARRGGGTSGLLSIVGRMLFFSIPLIAGTTVQFSDSTSTQPSFPSS